MQPRTKISTADLIARLPVLGAMIAIAAAATGTDESDAELKSG